VLEILSESFTQFKFKYNMNKISMTLSELIKELQAAAKIMKSKSAILLSKASSSGIKPKTSKFRKKKCGAVDQLALDPMLSLKGNASSVARRVTGKRST
jgi:hypothetical protein